VALQALTVISMGGIANHAPHRKKALLLFATIGSLAATCFLILPSSSMFWALSSILAITANVTFGASTVALNAYIPFLARTTRPVMSIMERLQSARTSSSSRETTVSSHDEDIDQPLLTPSYESEEVTALSKEYDTALSQTISRISSRGIALGYTSGILLLLLTLVPVTQLGGSTFSLRLAIGLSGMWWAIFTVPAALWLPSKDDKTSKSASSHTEWTLRSEIWSAWKRLGQMLMWREMKKLRNTFKFLAAWFLLSDAFTTITATAILFAKTELGMTPSQLIIVGTLVPACGILGSIVAPMVQHRTKWSNLKLLVILVILISLVPLYGVLGFLPIFGKGGFGGLTTAGEMYGLAVYFGLVYGAFAAYARAFYAELIPPGEEARWYGLYSITDKSSSFFGPLVVGVIADTTGNIRFAFFFLAIMIWLAVPVLTTVNVEQGRKDASRYVFGGGPRQALRTESED